MKYPQHTNGRQTCTKENPYTVYDRGNWEHPDSIEIDSTEYYIYYKCNCCGLEFKVPEPEY